MSLVVAKRQVYDQIKAYLSLEDQSLDFINTDVLACGAFEIETHPDVHLCQLGDRFYASPKLYEVMSEVIGSEAYKTNFIKGSLNPSSPYPSDCIYNVVYLNQRLYGKRIDPEILKDLSTCKNTTLVPVKQGYVKCSSLVLKWGNLPAVITEDDHLAKVFIGDGVDVLKIEKGHVAIKGFDYGFIGGASCVIGDVVYFFGPIEKHPNAEAIFNFLGKHQMKWQTLAFEEVMDLGGCFYIE